MEAEAAAPAALSGRMTSPTTSGLPNERQNDEGCFRGLDFFFFFVFLFSFWSTWPYNVCFSVFCILYCSFLLYVRKGNHGKVFVKQVPL